MLTPSEYFAVISALDQRSFQLVSGNYGNLAPDTYAWRTILQCAYMRLYLQRDSVRAALIGSPLPTPVEASLYPQTPAL